MAALRTTRHSNKERKSLNERSLSIIQLSRRPTDDIKYVSLKKKVATFYARHRTHGLRVSFSDDIKDGVAYNIIEFRLINNYQFVILDVWRKHGIERSQMVSLDQLYLEDYFDAIPGNEEDLIQIGYFTKTFLKKFQIENIENGSIANDDINGWYLSPMLFEHSSIDLLRKTEKGIIVSSALNVYYPQISPEYLFCVDSSNKDIEQRYSGWVYGPQLNKTGEFIDIYLKQCIINQIRRCIKNKSNKYLRSNLLNPSDYPMDTLMDNVFFGQLEELKRYQSLIDNKMIFPKVISYSYLQQLLIKIFTLKIDNGSIGVQKIKMKGTEKGLMEHGVYIDRYLMQYGLIHHGKTDGVSFECNMETIEFELWYSWISEHLGINHIIKENNDTSQTRLKKRNIKIKYSREYSSIYVVDLEYFNVNRHFIKSEKRLNDRNSTRIRLKKQNGSWNVV